MQITKLIDIKNKLKQIDIGMEPIIFLHSSMFQLGRLENGIPGLMNVIFEWLGPNSTLLMPSFSYHNRIDLPWCANDTKAKTGVLTEHFRKINGVRRSIHPIHSVTAYGKHAEFFVSDIESTSFGPKSSFAKLITVNAMNVSLGANFIGGATFLHYAEEYLKSPYRAFIDLGVRCLDSNNSVVPCEFKYFARRSINNLEYKNSWRTPLQDLVGNNLFVFDKINSANLMHAKMGDTIKFMIEQMQKNPFYCAENI